MLPTEKIAAYREGLRRQLSRPLSQVEKFELEKAQVEAQDIAKQLIQDYGAKRVILFGSVAKGQRLRPDSDIDIAVEGMPSEAYYRLAGDLQTETGRPVDLVRLENVRSGLKRIIFLEGVILETAAENIYQLINEIETEIEHFWQLMQDVGEATHRFSEQDQLSIHDLRALALLLAEIYTGAENLMLRIAKSLGETIPSGKAWHKELLEQLSADVPGLRPALFKQDVVNGLDEFRRFREVVYHLSASMYDWRQVNRLLGMAKPLLLLIIKNAEDFKSFLMSLTTNNDPSLNPDREGEEIFNESTIRKITT
jgi:predicted nucleotidyltransferase